MMKAAGLVGIGLIIAIAADGSEGFCLQSSTNFWVQDKDTDLLTEHLNRLYEEDGFLDFSRVIEVEWESCAESKEQSFPPSKCVQHAFRGWSADVSYEFCASR